jgi:hypothetical protein
MSGGALLVKAESRSGQVVVEMLLILPIFLSIVFTIMEIGYVSFRLILLNHATYEAVRVGGMTYSYHGIRETQANSVIHKIIPDLSRFECTTDQTMPPDNQAGVPNSDLVCTATEDVSLIFPISSIILSKPRGTGKRRLVATVRMPIEVPLKK